MLALCACVCLCVICVTSVSWYRKWNRCSDGPTAGKVSKDTFSAHRRDLSHTHTHRYTSILPKGHYVSPLSKRGPVFLVILKIKNRIETSSLPSSFNIMLLKICGDSHPSVTSTYQWRGLLCTALDPFSHLMVVCLPKTFSSRQLVRLARTHLVLTEEITHTYTHSGTFETTVCYFDSSSVALCYYETETILRCPEKLGILPPPHTHTHIHADSQSRMCGWR